MRASGKLSVLIIILAVAASLLAGQNVSFSVSPAQLKPGDKGVLSATLSIPKELNKKQSYDPSEGEGSYLYVSGTAPGLAFGSTQYPPADHVSSDGIWEYYGPLTLRLPFTVNADAKPGRISIQTAMGYGLCHKSNGFCDPPSESTGSAAVTILAGALTPDTPVSSDTLSDTVQAFAATDTGSVATSAETSESASDPASTAPAKILLYMLMAILGGIVLNFTPCVLPILPIRVMSMINQAQKDVKKVMLHTLVYTLGVLISFGAIAAVFVIARAAGVNLTYGFLSQSLVYNMIMLSILFIFGLSLLGVLEFTVPGMNAAAKTTSKKGYAGSFFGGVFAFLMGFACMGPFMGPALEVAVRLSSPLLVIFFLLIGLGFALPFIVISLFPKALKLIPKPGEWMNIFKEVMGFLLLLLTWKYFANVWGLTKSGAYLLDAAHYIVFLGFGAWLYGRFAKPEYRKAVQIIFTLLAIGVIAWAAWHYLPLKPKHEPPQMAIAAVDGLTPADHPGWYVFSPETLAKLQSEGKTVFLDIGAAWCTNCKVNEKKVLHTEDIMSEFQKRGVVLLKGDFTREDPVLKKWIQDGGSIGVPFNVLYIPGQQPIKLPELFSKDDIRKALSQIPANPEAQ